MTGRRWHRYELGRVTAAAPSLPAAPLPPDPPRDRPLINARRGRDFPRPQCAATTGRGKRCTRTVQYQRQGGQMVATPWD